jgi:hypothetical protein
MLLLLQVSIQQSSQQSSSSLVPASSLGCFVSGPGPIYDGVWSGLSHDVRCRAGHTCSFHEPKVSVISGWKGNKHRKALYDF